MLDPESYEQLEEERIVNDVDMESYTPETVSTSHHREEVKQAGPEDRKQNSAQDSVDGNAVSIGELRTSRRLRKPKVCKTFFLFNFPVILLFLCELFSYMQITFNFRC